MSVVLKKRSYLRDALAATRETIYGLVGWTLVAPLAALVPKRRDWIAVIGRSDGQFLDNTKYFYLEAAGADGAGLRVVQVTENNEVFDMLAAAGLPALRYPTPAAIWFLCRCGTAVVDSIEWQRRWRCFLLARARMVQLWHGVGFKRIEFDKWRNEARGRRRLVSSPRMFWIRMLRRLLRGRLRRYSAVVTTSNFYRERVFIPAFRSEHVVASGYPRNCFGLLQGKAREHAWLNVDPLVKDNLPRWRESGRRIVLVAPTFRDSRVSPMGLDEATCRRLDAFADEHGFEFLFKFHPYERGAPEFARLQHLHLLAPLSDAYPIFPSLHSMVTDYSSIYMDFLLLDRPVLFLTPDLEEYGRQDRGIQFDFEAMTPGPKVSSWHELMDRLLDPGDAWAARRATVRKLAFDDLPAAGATRRLLDWMRELGWTSSPTEPRTSVA